MGQFYINTKNEDELTVIGYKTHSDKTKAINAMLSTSIKEAMKK